MSGYHLAELNLGRIRAPLDAPEMAEFHAALGPINEIAEHSPGFVWRLTDDDGGSSSYVEIPGNDDPLLIPNMSVWRDLDALKHFMYRSGHASYLRRRREWFEAMDGPTTVLWWIPAGEIPTLDDAIKRLDHLREHGPTSDGWTLADPFDPPSPTV